MTMSMHWIMRDWRLKMRILGTMHFSEKHTPANICDRLLNARIDFGEWPKDGKGRITKSEEALRCEKLAYFGMEPLLDKRVLTSDCGSDVAMEAEKNCLWDWNRCACHYLNIALQSALKRPCIQKFVEPLVELAHKFSRSRFLWMEFKKVQLEMLHRVEVAKLFLNPRNLGIPWHSIRFLAVRFRAFSPWSLNRFP